MNRIIFSILSNKLPRVATALAAVSVETVIALPSHLRCW